jgi:hypothetical protein
MLSPWEASMMSGVTLEMEPVAKKRGRPKSDKVRGIGVAVRIDPNLMGKARVVAARRNLDVGPYLSQLLEGPVNRDYLAVLKELSDMEAEQKGARK